MKNWRHLHLALYLTLISFVGIIGCRTGDASAVQIEQAGFESPLPDNYRPDNNPVTFDEDPSNLPQSHLEIYINIDGIEVQNPTKYAKHPPGASAICWNGEYSFS